MIQRVGPIVKFTEEVKGIKSNNSFSELERERRLRV
jgi:hypothetical protein